MRLIKSLCSDRYWCLAMKANQKNKKQQVALARLVKNNVPMKDARRILNSKLSDGSGVKPKK